VWTLLHLDAESMRKGLCSRLIVAGGEKMVKQESAVKAKQGRDALAKALYSRLFDHVVQCVNSALRMKGGNQGAGMQVNLNGTAHWQSLSILNIAANLVVNVENQSAKRNSFSNHTLWPTRKRC
jgi:myosin heavy subunit